MPHVQPVCTPCMPQGPIYACHVHWDNFMPCMTCALVVGMILPMHTHGQNITCFTQPRACHTGTLTPLFAAPWCCPSLCYVLAALLAPAVAHEHTPLALPHYGPLPFIDAQMAMHPTSTCVKLPRPSQCDTAREQLEQETLEQEQAALRMVASQVMWQSCGEPYLLQPFIPDMRGNEYR